MNPSISACDDKERVEACQEQGQGQEVMQTLTEEETQTMTGGEELPLERNEEGAEVKMQMNDNDGQREQYEEQTNQIVEVGLKSSIVNLPCIYLHIRLSSDSKH